MWKQDDEPGVGCAGRGIITAIDLLESSELILTIWLYFYDVLECCLWGLLCRFEGKAKVYSLFWGNDGLICNNICKGIARYAQTSGVRLGGLICPRKLTVKLLW